MNVAAQRDEWRERLARVGVWLPSLTDGSSTPAETAKLVEELGFGTLWIGGGAVAEDAFDRFRQAIEATSSLVLASGIAVVWARPAAEMAAAASAVARIRTGGFLLGLGISHQPMVEQLGHAYERPYAHMVRYLDEMDAAAPRDDPMSPPRVLAALGPKMLRLAGERTLGAHPYFVPVAHTERARAELGPGPLLAPEVGVVLDTDPAMAREIARGPRTILQRLNYVESLRRLGYGDDDFADGGSDRLIYDVIVWGDEEAIAARVRAHLDAGADHVSVQPITPGGLSEGLEVLRRLGPVLSSL